MKQRRFQFKQFAVEFSRSAMKVGTDGVLLGAWCNLDNVVRALDVGTGCGLIALQLAQRNANLTVVGLEIDPEACNDAQENFLASPWSDRLNLVQGDFREFHTNEKFDLLISNPPFFTQDVLSPNNQRAMARHSGSLPLPDFFDCGMALLLETGTMAFIYPADCEVYIERLLKERKLFTHRKTYVHSVEGKPAKRILWQVGRNLGNCERTVEHLVIAYGPLDYTQEYVELTGSFYLNM